MRQVTNHPLRVLALCALLLVLAWPCATVQAKVEQKPVYLCGYAVNFADSTAYLTAIQCIDTAYVESKNGFLMDRNQYSSQLNHYLKKVSGGKEYICTVLFDRKQSRLQKRVARVRKRGEGDETTHLKVLGEAEFQFIGEQYVAPDVMEVDEETDEGQTSAAPADKAPAQDKARSKHARGEAKQKGGRH